MNIPDLPYWLFGKLEFRSLATYSTIAAVAASIVVISTLGTLGLITWFGKWRYLWTEWLTSVDHKRIGIMYIVLSLLMLVRGVIEGVLMRLQQAVAINDPGFLPPEHFAQLFSTHGTIMIIFMGMPFLTGMINFVMPLQIGSRDVAFPTLNSISLWLTGAGATLLMISLVLGKFSTGGWSGYPPFTEITFNPGVGVDYWIWAISLASIGSTLTGLNFIVTIFKNRAPGMYLFRMPLFCWTALCTSILMVFAMPPLTVATALLALDRYLGFHMFTNDAGGNMMNYANLFWLFGHPEVYILVLPAFGVFSSVFSNFSGKTLYGYKSLVLATMSIAVLSFTVWLHHFFTMGQAAHLNAIFGIATMTIGIPTGVKIYDWMLTMYRGRVRLTSPHLWAMAFLVFFAIGGLTGILLAAAPVDFQVHNTVFLIAHFHNMLIPGLLFGMLAGYQFWFPKAFGFRLDESWGKITVFCFVVGFFFTFIPLYFTGLQGMPRRAQELFEPSFEPWLIISAGGSLLLLAGLTSLFIQLYRSIRNREHLAVPVGDPWDGRTLEWATPSPVPQYNFATIPNVRNRDDFTHMKLDGRAYRTQDSYEAITLPRNNALGPIIGIAGAAAGFALVWHIWWLVLVALVLILAAVIGFSFRTETEYEIPAEEVARREQAWLEMVARTEPVDRSLENDTRNYGLALPPPEIRQSLPDTMKGDANEPQGAKT